MRIEDIIKERKDFLIYKSEIIYDLLNEAVCSGDYTSFLDKKGIEYRKKLKKVFKEDKNLPYHKLINNNIKYKKILDNFNEYHIDNIAYAIKCGISREIVVKFLCSKNFYSIDILSDENAAIINELDKRNIESLSKYNLKKDKTLSSIDTSKYTVSQLHSIIDMYIKCREKYKFSIIETEKAIKELLQTCVNINDYNLIANDIILEKYFENAL